MNIIYYIIKINYFLFNLFCQKYCNYYKFKYPNKNEYKINYKNKPDIENIIYYLEIYKYGKFTNIQLYNILTNEIMIMTHINSN
jgi:hypothetical protein